MPHYRVAFFERLRESLAAAGVDLSVIYGQPERRAALRRDVEDLAWGRRVRNRYLGTTTRHVIWQPCVAEAARADLVIVEQAARLLLNYALLAMQSVGVTRVAFWGHGANLASESAFGPAEAVKRWSSRQPHWWFAYTEGSKTRVVDLGFPADRVTVAENSMRTFDRRAPEARIAERDLEGFRDQHSIGGGPVAIFVGGLYAAKRLDLLVDTATAVRADFPGFVLLVVGDGSERAFIERAAQTRPWLRYLGPDFGHTKQLALRAADVLLIPGSVGLGILDGFSSALPLVTTTGDHGPEIEYLTEGVNGLMTAATADDYAGAVKALFYDNARLKALSAGARASAERHTLDAMVTGFTAGIEAALERDLGDGRP